MAVEYISPAEAMGYAQHTRHDRRKRSERARRAGLASGRKRRQLADPPRCRALRQRELALKFPVRLVDREEFDRLDFERRLRAKIQPNERGTETLWAEYQSCVRAYKAQGQGFLTTNGQRSEALRKRGRPRCERTVRRAHAHLAEMGLLRRFHDRRGGSRAGQKDRLRVQIAPSFVHPPLAAGASAQRASAPASEILIRRPDGRSGDPPAKPAGNDGYEEGERNAVADDLTPTPEQESLFEAHFEQVRAEQERKRVQELLSDRSGHGGRARGALGLPETEGPLDRQRPGGARR